MSPQERAQEAKSMIADGEWVQEEALLWSRRIYLGSFMSLDPCGRYHHFLSPNGYSQKCEDFWEGLEAELQATELSLEFGEGDPTDVFAVEYKNAEEG